MKTPQIQLLLFIFQIGTSLSQDLASNLVFDAIFYLNNHGSLEVAGLRTREAAQKHWLQTGVKAGYQATSTFHSKQYLDRYPDLKAKFGDDYEAATKHYLTTGIHENRVGYLAKGGYGRYTVRNPASGIYVSTSDRCAGAVDSLVWNNKEFLNGWDHGRQLQVALTTPPFGECWNPTEAGGLTNERGWTTDSVLISLDLQGSVLSTTNNPGYWYRPGQKTIYSSAPNCTVGTMPYDTRTPHPYPLSKKVRIGALGMDNCIEFLTSIDIGDGQPPNYHYLQTEGPTGYGMADFNKIYSVNPDTGAIYNTANGSLPVVVATSDNEYAFGVFTDVKLPELTKYGVPGVFYGHYATPGDAENVAFNYACYKWTLVFRQEPQPAGTVLNYRSYICVGTVQDVAQCIKQAKKVTSEHGGNPNSMSLADQHDPDLQTL